MVVLCRWYRDTLDSHESVLGLMSPSSGSLLGVVVSRVFFEGRPGVLGVPYGVSRSVGQV